MKPITQFVIPYICSLLSDEEIANRWIPKNDLNMQLLMSTYLDADIKNSALTFVKTHFWFLLEANAKLFFLSFRMNVLLRLIKKIYLKKNLQREIKLIN